MNLNSTISNPQTDEYYAIHQVRFQIVLDVISQLRLPKNARILDIGCFPLFIFNELKKRGYRIRGVASHHEPVTNKRIHHLNIEKEKLPFYPNYFDLVLMSEVIEHLTADPHEYLSQIKRVLKKNGKLVITTPNGAHLKNRAKLLFGKSPSFPVEQLRDTKLDDDSIYYRHNREFTKYELTSIIKQEKFNITHAKYVSFYTPNRIGYPTSFVQQVGYAITKVFPPLRDSLLVVAKK